MAHPSRRRSTLPLLVALAALLVVLLPAASRAAATLPVRLEAGIQRGFTFSGTGAVLTSRTRTVASPVTVSADQRAWIAGRGTHVRIVSGSFAGFWIKESMTAYQPGLVVTRTFATPERTAFAAGAYLGYRFDSGWNVAGTKYATLSRDSAALVSRRGVINGRPYAEVVSGGWAGHWMPIVSPTVLTAQRLTCAAPDHVPAGSQQVLRVLPGAVNQVALTFDMGGRIDPARAIVNRLILDRVCTTFFPTGAMTSTPEGQAVMQLIGRHPYLFELGSHTEHHCDLVRGGGGSPSAAPCAGTGFSDQRIRDEMTIAQGKLRSASGLDPRPYWRPPYGSHDARVRNLVASVGYTKTLLWDVDTIDWRPVADGGPTAAAIADKVAVNAVNGTDVLMHLGGFNTLDALPSMVQRLRARGLQPTTISDILR
jgi:peptidoglycan/xylan/chitin deacetylase (PgdA/CDA1 family)